MRRPPAVAHRALVTERGNRCPSWEARAGLPMSRGAVADEPAKRPKASAAMPVFEVLSTSRGRPNLRRWALSRAAAPWWAMSITLMAALAIGLLTLPPPTGAVCATIDRPAATGRSGTPTARTAHPVALPASMALAGSGSQTRVLPMSSSACEVEF